MKTEKLDKLLRINVDIPWRDAPEFEEWFKDVVCV